MPPSKLELLQGTLDLLILKTLDSMGPLHGYGLARRLELTSGEVLSLNQGTLYPALLRLEQRGWIRSEYGLSDNNRKARFYSLTARGRKQLVAEQQNWLLLSGMVNRVLEGL